jgi:hypothetical protein
MVSCPVVVVMMLESRVVRRVHCDEYVASNILVTTRLSSIITTTTGQETIGSKRQSDLLTMGVNTPETC